VRLCVQGRVQGRVAACRAGEVQMQALVWVWRPEGYLFSFLCACVRVWVIKETTHKRVLGAFLNKCVCVCVRACVCVWGGGCVWVFVGGKNTRKGVLEGVARTHGCELARVDAHQPAVFR
jgi:hypothetical protein